MAEKPLTVAKYLAGLPKERRDALREVRRVIRENLDDGFKEGIQYGAIGYHVPHSVYPDGYHCDPSQPLPFAGLASQKNYMTLSLFCLYTSKADEEWFRETWLKSGKRLDMGKSCVRFRKLEDVPLDVVGKAIKRITVKKFVASYEAGFGHSRKKAATKKTTKKTKTKKKTATRKTARKA
jgi:hypothetical protein